MNETERYPCQVVAVRRSVVLRSSRGGRHPDPSPGVLGRFRAVAVDSRGWIYTGSREPVVLVWNPDGSFRTVLGREGEGPGEFSTGVVSIVVDASDSVHARDRRGRWLVFGPDLRFARQFLVPPDDGRAVHLAEPGRIVATAPVSGAGAGALVSVLDREGRLVRSAGKPRPGRAADVLSTRPSATAPGGSVWIAPPVPGRARGSPEGFVLERRTLPSGRLQQVLRRDTPWLPLGGYPDEPGLPDFRVFHVDRAGRIWVGLSVKDPRWTPQRPGEHPDARAAERYDFRLEVLDPQRGAVLASVVVDSMQEDSFPPVFPIDAGRTVAVGMTRDELGLVTLELFDLRLAEKR